MTGGELMGKVRDLCEELGLLVFHDHDSRRSWEPGFPDLLIAGPSGHLFREIKGSEDTVSPAQRQWGRMLVKGRADWKVWRPGDWRSGLIRRELEVIC